MSDLSCKHGHLARSCQMCDMERDLAEARAALLADRPDVARLIERCVAPSDVGGYADPEIASTLESLSAQLAEKDRELAATREEYAKLQSVVSSQGLELMRQLDELAAAIERAESHVTHINDLELRLAAARGACGEMRGALQELRIRLHAAGRRPEECYEMSIIEAALDAGRKET